MKATWPTNCGAVSMQRGCPLVNYRYPMASYDWLDLQIRAHAEFGRRLEAVTDWQATADLVEAFLAQKRTAP